MASVAQLIRSYARRYGVDPQAALAVARTEGGLRWGAVGDQGTSFGPFQLHEGGALPRGKGAAWANSPEGIAYALSRMAESGARGLRGRAAIESIVRNFERPADPDTSISRALGFYGGDVPEGTGTQGAAIYSEETAPMDSQADPRRQVLSALIDAAGDRSPDYEKVIAALGQVGAARRAPASSPAADPSSPAAGGGAVSGGISELFYDPLGAIKNGQQIDAIGGHDDHVHFASGNPQLMLAAIRKARQLGLNVTENPYTDSSIGGHVEGSHHYRRFPGRYNGRQLGQGIDASGSAQAMAALYRWLSRR